MESEFSCRTKGASHRTTCLTTNTKCISSWEMTHEYGLYEELILGLKEKLCSLTVRRCCFMINTQWLIKTPLIEKVSEVFRNSLDILEFRDEVFIDRIFYLSVTKSWNFIFSKKFLQFYFIVNGKSLHMRIFDGLRQRDCIENIFFVKQKNCDFIKRFLYSFHYVNNFFMKQSLKATSIIESIVVLLVVVSWIVGVYGLLNSSQKLARSSSDRIEAIQIARDGLEAFTNIRDTNAQLFAADLQNCWNVTNYEDSCIGSPTITHDIRHSATQWLIISRNTNNQFELTRRNIGWWYSTNGYRNRFRVQKDSRWFYTQNWGTDFLPNYTREMKVEYFNADNSVWNSNSPKMRVTAIVQWNDPARETPRKIEMNTILTNWRAQK